jgi:hypothetical protein
VIVAQTTRAITEGQAHDLRARLALFLLGLIVWNLTVEGPPVSSPLKSLRRDLDTVADRLTESERDEILQLSAITSACRRATVESICRGSLATRECVVLRFNVTGARGPEGDQNHGNHACRDMLCMI